MVAVDLVVGAWLDLPVHGMRPLTPADGARRRIVVHGGRQSAVVVVGRWWRWAIWGWRRLFVGHYG